MRLTGKTAIVTGGGSGFGEGIAKTYAREGANVVVNDLNGPAAERVASEIALAGGKAIAVAGNVAQRDDWQTLREAALEDFGSVQIVVNNAGTTHRNKPVLEVTEAEFDRVYAVNVKSIYWSVQEFVPYFREQGGGVLHQYRVDGGCAAAAGPRLVQRQQGRGDHREQVACRRTGSGPHSRELRESGDGRNGAAVGVHGR